MKSSSPAAELSVKVEIVERISLSVEMLRSIRGSGNFSFRRKRVHQKSFVSSRIRAISSEGNPLFAG